ncbi:class I SAM-dependent methyltransferase [Bacillus carboniphilus]|uniref:Class I SAM-dependent methyltransferase n=1 Tax=Bacillus carboniphilus TaxID=86663 RepID=A0ABP3G7I0_9BACI
MIEHEFDDLLHINTRADQKGMVTSFHYYPYEPTPYEALQWLFTQYTLSPNDHVVDYGSGKGRLAFFIHHLFQAAVVGVEMNEHFHKDALVNREYYLKKLKGKDADIHFYCCLAEDYKVKPVDNRFYFFNPFSIQIFMKIANNILGSIEKHPREVELILYYGSEDYTYYLENQTPFLLKEEITIPNLYDKNPNERFLIYKWDY